VALMDPKPNLGNTRNRTITHRQLINARSLFLWQGVRAEEVPRKM
jgi:hypothetical protein